jgi:tRNA U55 pseudouridine synthase TruB
MNKLHALNGVFAVNKPIGWTSRDVVNRVQNVLTTSWWTEQNLPVPKKKVKMGHGGTLVRHLLFWNMSVDGLLFVLPRANSM